MYKIKAWSPFLKRGKAWSVDLLTGLHFQKHCLGFDVYIEVLGFGIRLSRTKAGER